MKYNISPQEAWEKLLILTRETNVHSFGNIHKLVKCVLKEPGRHASVGTALENMSIPQDYTLTSKNIHITGFSTTKSLIAPMRAQLIADGIFPSFSGGEFGMAISDLLYNKPQNSDATIVFPDASIITDRLPRGWTIDDASDAIKESQDLLTGALAHYAEYGLIVTSTIPIPSLLIQSLRSMADRTRLARMWREFDIALLDLALDLNIAVIDASALFISYGVEVEDANLQDVTGLPYALPAVDHWAIAASRALRAYFGITRKALVTDLDNTLWNGVLGDIGINGIMTASPSTKGRQRYQRLLSQLSSQGILLAISSKNNAQAVNEAITSEEILVGQDIFLVKEIGWDPKRDHINRIANSLNISSDSIVFVDDSAFEREDVVDAHPGIAVVDSSGMPGDLAKRVLEDDPFLVPKITNEDNMRISSIRNNIIISQASYNKNSYNDYLASLEQTIYISPMQEKDIPRVVQMTQRTNQFHLVTTRLNEDDIREIYNRLDCEIYTIRLTDRLCEHGTIGLLFLRSNDFSILSVDNMLLSCRVFERGVEQAVIDQLLVDSKDRYTHVESLYRESLKNRRFSNFWVDCGFSNKNVDKELKKYIIDVGKYSIKTSQIIKVIRKPGRLLP